MISIIIIVKNDKRIKYTLEKLKNVKKPEKIEVLVIDASHGELNEIKKRSLWTHWIAFKSMANKKTTIPEQRNVGVKNAKGKIIVFIDSDCIPDKNWLIEVTKPILNKKENIVAGKVRLEDKNSLHTLEKEKTLNKKYLDECPTMNVAINKKVFDKVGFYDETFQYGSDVDFFWRARHSGFRIYYNPNAIIYHDVGDTKNELRRMYVYGKARVKLYKKNNFRLKYFWGNEFLTIFYPLYFIFLPITFIIYFYPLLILIPIIKYFNKNPFKVILMKTYYGLGVLRALILPE